MLPLYLHPQITGYEQNHAAFPLKENPYKAAQNPQQTSYQMFRIISSMILYINLTSACVSQHIRQLIRQLSCLLDRNLNQIVILSQFKIATMILRRYCDVWIFLPVPSQHLPVFPITLRLLFSEILSFSFHLTSIRLLDIVSKSNKKGQLQIFRLITALTLFSVFPCPIPYIE